MLKTAYLFLLMFSCVDICAEDFVIEDVEITSQNVQLSGSIVFPKNNKPYAAVVFVHGSGKQIRNMHWAKRFAAEGIVALVYDKRGVGQSGGEYESKQSVGEDNINLLADDAIAALKVLQQHPIARTLPLGLTGISQAGWIVPVAAEKTRVLDFMAIWSGPVSKISEEDIYSKYTADSDAKEVPSYAEALKARKTAYVWPSFLGKDTDSSESLSQFNKPGLWVFGAKDGSIPVDLSIDRLKQLITSGHPFEYVLFSNLGHNNMTASFSTVTDWIRRLVD